MTLPKLTFEILGGVVGWLVATFYDVVPLAVVMIAFILYDAWTAYQLDRRAKLMYPDKTKRHEAKFTSFAFGKVVRQTIPHRLAVILLAFLAEKYVFVHIHIPFRVHFSQMWVRFSLFGYAYAKRAHPCAPSAR